MRRIKALFALLFAVLTLVCCATKEDPDFRQVRWGMSAQQIKSAEASIDDADAYFDDELLIYHDFHFGEPATITYSLSDDALTSVRVDFDTQDRLLEEFMARFDDMALLLSEQYGEPLDDDKRKWVDPNKAGSLPEDRNPPGSPDEENDNIYLFFYILTYHLEWKTDRTFAQLHLEIRNQTTISFYLEIASLVGQP